MFQLIRDETTPTVMVGSRHQWAVRFTASRTSNASPAAIFVMRKALTTDVFADSLISVANALQMSALPVAPPDVDDQIYRVSTVTHLCRSEKAAEEFVSKMEDAVQYLVEDLHAADGLSQPEETLITPDND